MGSSIDFRPRLLITEDDFENQKFLLFFLKRYFFVDICDSAESFYEMMKKQKYDIIMMDISIRGDKNGLELTRELKSDPTTSAIPVLCYTAHAFNRDRINALEAGCDVYISKPTEVYSLLDSLLDLLKQKGKIIMDGPSHGSYATS
jgi:two-component system, cell cycle response regulator DivK